jgi:hypothetical protein
VSAQLSQWDEDRGTFRDKPLQNWATHGADWFRNFAQGYVERQITGQRGRYRSRLDGGSWDPR